MPPAGSSAPIAMRPRTSPRSSAISSRTPSSSATTLRARAATASPASVGATAAAGALEQLGAELGLEPADLVRQRRLRDVELLGGAREVAMAGDGLDVYELAQLHRRLIVYHDQSVDNKILHQIDRAE